MARLRFLIFLLVVFHGLVVARASDGWVVTVADTADYFPPMLGNGHTGVVMDPTGSHPRKMFQATVFDDGRIGEVSTIRRVISPVCIDVTVGDAGPRMKKWRQKLDMRRAAVVTSYRLGDVDVSITYRALRQMPHAVMAEVDLRAADNAEVMVSVHPDLPTDLPGAVSAGATIWCEDGGIKIRRSSAAYNGVRDVMASAASLVVDSLWRRVGTDSVSISLKKGERARVWAVGTTVSSADFSDPYNEADRQVVYAVREGDRQLIRRHEKQWADLWRSDVEIDGDETLQRMARTALYNLYSSIREGSGLSIAPMGLTSDKYYGHIFWDADTWILPVLAVLNPELARSMADYRIDRLPGARRRAAAYGYKGAMYPWESDHRGEESTPTFALTGPLEHHITADVARGAWLCYSVTADTAWLRERGYPMMKECADFWVSRAEPSADGDSWSIRNVVGADEYAIGVDDDAFTNAAVKNALRHTADAARVLGLTPDPQWGTVADGLVFHRMPDGITFREHAAYNGEMTKQADVELLAYPLGLMTDPREIEANIDYYSARIDSVGGPAMSHSAMAVNYARMQRPEKARSLIERSFRPNLRGGFCNLSETPGNDEIYFMTAAGGLLQALIFGYAGVEISDKGLVQVASELPAGLKKVRVLTPAGIFERSNSR